MQTTLTRALINIQDSISLAVTRKNPPPKTLMKAATMLTILMPPRLEVGYIFTQTQLRLAVLIALQLCTVSNSAQQQIQI